MEQSDLGPYCPYCFPASENFLLLKRKIAAYGISRHHFFASADTIFSHVLSVLTSCHALLCLLLNMELLKAHNMDPDQTAQYEAVESWHILFAYKL